MLKLKQHDSESDMQKRWAKKRKSQQEFGIEKEFHVRQLKRRRMKLTQKEKQK